MQKNLSEQEKSTLNQLLQVNIISTNSSNSARSKNKNLRCVNTKFYHTTNNGNFTKSKDKNRFAIQPRLPLTLQSFFHEPSNSDKKEILTFKPKRSVKIKGGGIPLKFVGKATLNCEKTFGKSDSAGCRTSNTSNNLNNDNQSIDSNTEFKTAYILKYAQNSSNFLKLSKFADLISENRKRQYEDYFNRISKMLENQSNIFFCEEKNDNDELYSNFSIPKISNTFYSTTYSSFSDFKTKSNFYNSNNNKKIIIACYEFNNLLCKYVNLIFNELSEIKNEKMKLLRKSYDQEIRLNSKAKELEELTKYLNRYDVNAKIYLRKGREYSVQQVKEKFNQKENEYIVNIYKLEEEIRNLTVLLNKNKEYYTKFKETEKEVEKNKKQSEELRFAYQKELHEKTLQIDIEKDRGEESNNKITELEQIIEEFKKEQEDNKRQEIEIMARIKKMKMVIDEKNENIKMMNEELEWFVREYNKEKFNHKNTQNALRTLESRIFKDEEEKEKEMKIKENKKEEKKVKKNNRNKIENSKNNEKNNDIAKALVLLEEEEEG